ncbi:MAG TPA: response regulator [Candidatus Polarisedimenticolia bacterium]|jgi:two-component system chemotaxis response regulator CheY|nr:response regulator [Candidatus Polarisedimenticolia bacterium]
MPLSVLLVDDAGFVRSMLRAILESGDHRVVAEASDGASALSLKDELQPDLIITDLIMPGMDGVETTRALVGADPSVRVIVSAARDQEGAVLRALAAGARDFLRKPFSPAEVLGALQDLETPADPDPGPERRVALRLTLRPGTSLPSARLRVLAARCSSLGRVVSGMPPSGIPLQEGGAPVLDLTLQTRHSPEAAKRFLRPLPAVLDVTAEIVLEPEPEASMELSLPAPPLQGTVRVRAELLQRLLDRAETARADRDLLAAALETSGAPGSDEALKRLERSLAEIRAEILSARMVPFDRIAPRLGRCVEESAAASGREAVFSLTGGESRVDLAHLEQIAQILMRLLPRIVREGVQRSDILRQMGWIEPCRVTTAVSRNGSALVLRSGVSAPPHPKPGGLLAGEIGDLVARLGGSAAVVGDGEDWKVEMVLPAGVALVRSYLCQVGKQLLAVPVANVERSVELDVSQIRLREGRSFWEEDPEEPIPLVRFDRIPWVDADGPSLRGFSGLLYRVGPQRYALATDAVLGQADVVIRPPLNGGEEARLAGTAILSDGSTALVPDLLRLARVR